MSQCLNWFLHFERTWDKCVVSPQENILTIKNTWAFWSVCCIIYCVFNLCINQVSSDIWVRTIKMKQHKHRWAQKLCIKILGTQCFVWNHTGTRQYNWCCYLNSVILWNLYNVNSEWLKLHKSVIFWAQHCCSVNVIHPVSWLVEWKHSPWKWKQSVLVPDWIMYNLQ